MISLLILSILILFILSNNFKVIYDKEEILISNLITSYVLAISLIGVFSVFLIIFEFSKFPILFFSILITIFYLYLNKINNQNFVNFIKSMKLIFQIFEKNYKKNKFIIFLIFWLYFISFGPINHPDTITTYVGYPYQFFLQNKHFIDGGLSQGLLGIGDFSNLSFIQEGNTWLIRSIQSIPIIFLVSIFLLRKTKNFLILAFLTCPVFIQWLTIGKYLFLPDIAVSISYIVWCKFKERNSLLNLMILIILSLSFKISSLIISIPIALHLLIHFLTNKKNFISYSKQSQIKIWLLFFSISAFSSILLYRFHVTGNPFYPVFNNLFIPDNHQMISFENFLRSYMRGGGFPFNLIMTNNLNLLGMIIGPATGLLLISIPITNIFISKNKFISLSEIVPIMQIILLLTLSQGRADYFLSPIIIIFINDKNLPKELLLFPYSSKSKNFIFKIIFQLLLTIQIFIFMTLTLISGYQTLYSILNYDSSMSRYAYNYELSNILNNNSKEPIMNTSDRTALLFLKKEYIHEDKFKNCINHERNKNQSIPNCVKKLNPNSIIIYGDKSEIEKDFKCKEFSANITSRNPLKLKKGIFHICNISKS